MIQILFLSTLVAVAVTDSSHVIRKDTVYQVPAHIEERRIWHEVLHPQPCQVRIEIFDAGGKKVRTFLDRTLGGGVYNWHWDALDDSGDYVAEGPYRAVIDDCKRAFYESMTIFYKPGEKDFQLTDTIISIEKGIPIRVLADSVRVSGTVLSPMSDFPFYSFGDTLLTRGMHSIPMKSEVLHPGAKARLHLRTKLIERAYEIELRK